MVVQTKKMWVSLLLFLVIGLMAFTMTALAAEVKNDTQIVGDLGLLKGEGDGLTPAYLAKPTQRIQAAIIFLRLKGLEAEAHAFTGTNNFSDAAMDSVGNQKIMAYLKANPSLGWVGIGDNKFDPLANITAQQFYKVLLESLGYKTGTDFTFDGVFDFGGKMGLTQLAKFDLLKNENIATAIVEALQVNVKDKGKKLLETLVEAKVIDKDKAVFAAYSRLSFLANDTLGKYLVDANGRALYYFTKDEANVSNCKDTCLANWPAYYADKLQVPAQLNASDFGVITRGDGTKQTTYRGMPLYYFIKDKLAGDVLGEGANKVWYTVKAPETVKLATNSELGTFLVDGNGMTLYYYDKDPQGSSVCFDKCVVAWPLFYSDYVVVPSGLNAADFGVITRSDGRKQSTYKGFPLYYFVKDLKVGDTLGQNVGKVWFVIDPVKFDGTTVSKAAAAAKAAPKSYSIEISNYAFNPKEITVEVGSTITFTNQDDVKHNAVAVDGSFSTPLLDKGESATITLSKAGEFEFYCAPHKRIMTGKIIVK